MQQIISKLESFFEHGGAWMIVNTYNNQALLLLEPQIVREGERLLLKFNSLNDRGGNSVFVKSVPAFEEGTLYIENEEGNILMIQVLTLANYRAYIQPNYLNAPDFDRFEDLKNYLTSMRDE